MNIRDAILKAADHIEANPSLFRFSSNTIPRAPDCRTPGCALGWIGVFAGISGSVSDVGAAMGIDFGEFLHELDVMPMGARSWHHDAKEAAGHMRVYADRHYPAPVVAPVSEDRQLVPWSSVAFKPAMLRV